MKLVTFIRDSSERLGAFALGEQDAVVVDLNQADPLLPPDILAFLEMGEGGRRRAIEVLENPAEETCYPLSGVKLRAPIPRPQKIIGIGLNYRDHAAEAGQPVPEIPIIFAKYPNAVVGPGEAIVLPGASQQVDFEAEMAFVIGRRGRHVSEAQAMDYVAGYLPFNDVSARDYQFQTSQWTIGKTFDTFAPMGPALVTRDEVPDPHNLHLQLTINGQVFQSSNTNQVIFKIPQLISYLSRVMTLEPGDVVATGTPPGVGFARKPPRFLRPGDLVEIEIEALGRLSNPVVDERDSSLYAG